MAKITEEDFYDDFKPQLNHFDDNASFDGCMFETYGEELGEAKAVASKKFFLNNVLLAERKYLMNLFLELNKKNPIGQDGAKYMFH